MHNYPSDISREQYELIREELENAKRKTMPRKIDLYDVFCAVLYVVKGGIQWRMLPSDFLKWQLCYYYFKVWSAKAAKENAESILERI
ncbi:MAG: transposase [Ruminococcus sp.]|nr:transposase [Ruminococcus sp.]